MQVPLTRRRVVCAAAVATALAMPAAAEAAYTGTVAGATVTLTGDGASDNLVVTQNTAATPLLTHNRPANEGFVDLTDFDSATAGAQTVPANATVTLVVSAGAGDDAVTVTGASVLTASIGGGDGDDVITGSVRADALRGDAGNDRVVGAPGNDDMDGGDGNDTLVWNNGDNNDAMDGDGGNDETEVNGAANAGDAFTIVPAGQRVRFDRTNLVPFTLDVATERMTVNGLGGGDTIAGAAGLAPLIAIALNGGTGPDTITGGDGAELITGGEDADTLDGAGGDDRVVGDRGNDTMRGGPGDDTLVWNNGDNNDVMDGQDGSDRVEVNGAGAGDVFTTAAVAQRVRFDRTNLVPFNLDIGTAEALQVNGLGGDDSLTVGAGTAALLAVTGEGGSGNDTMLGAEGAEHFGGGSGNDDLAGGGGSDHLEGGAGTDTLRARDGFADLVSCGAEADSVLADRAGDTVAADCETVRRAGGLASTVRVSDRVAVTLRRGRPIVRPQVTCPAASAGGCTGTLTITARVRTAGGRLVATLGRGRFEIDAGERERVTVRLPRALGRLIGTGSRRARAVTASRDAAGNLAERSESIRLLRVRR